MRQAHSDKGWLEHSSHGGFFGVSLGYDFCAEHEMGAGFIRTQMGIAPNDFPLGVQARMQTRVPPNLGWVEYEARPTDKRFKATKPAALLYCTEMQSYDGSFETLSPLAKAKYFDVDFFWDWTSKHHREDSDDFMSSWTGRSGFALHVRGADNVAKLREVHEGFLAGTISLADPSVIGFLRKSLCFVLTPKLSVEVKAEVLAKDVAHKNLHDAAAACGIEAELKVAGKGFYALSPAWRAGQGSDLLFYLNPQDQKKYNHGWFTLDELQQWAQDKGPVVDSQGIEKALKAETPDWSIYLLRGLNQAGIGLRVRESFVWLDPEKSKIGVRLLVSAKTDADLLRDGIYPIEDLQKYVDVGRSMKTLKAAVPA